jgi:RNA polymerase sigma-B factor
MTAVRDDLLPVTIPRPVPAEPAPVAEDTLQRLLERLAEMPAGHPARERLRERVITLGLPLAEYLARRYRNRGEQLDDLVQVATVGLIKAVDGYDPVRGAAFSSYAVPTIVGELKRHFRDKGWSVRVPRRLQELRIELTRAADQMTQELGRSPTVGELAGRLGATEEDVIAGLESAQAYATVSLYTPLTEDGSGTQLADVLGDLDPDLEGVEHREALKRLMAELPERERRILVMRFFGNMTQSRIAAETGMSQMHVSRLLSRTLRQLREGLMAED